MKIEEVIFYFLLLLVTLAGFEFMRKCEADITIARTVPPALERIAVNTACR